MEKINLSKITSGIDAQGTVHWVDGSKIAHKRYASLKDKYISAKDIVDLSFSVDRDDSGNILFATPEPIGIILDSVTVYYIMKLYFPDVELPLTEDGEEDVLAVYDMAKETGLYDTVLDTIFDVREFLNIVDREVSRFKGEAVIMRSGKVSDSLDELVSTVNNLANEMAVKTALQVEELQKNLELMPNSQEEMQEMIDKMSNIKTEEVKEEKPKIELVKD